MGVIVGCWWIQKGRAGRCYRLVRSLRSKARAGRAATPWAATAARRRGLEVMRRGKGTGDGAPGVSVPAAGAPRAGGPPSGRRQLRS